MSGTLPPGCTQREIDEAFDGYYNDEPDECYHEDYESDILSGRATCNICGHSWWQSGEEIQSEIDRIRECDEWQRRERKREIWRRLTDPVRWSLYRLLSLIWQRKSLAALTDDEIPF